ncbi:MAG: DUF3298 domain-containing protein [Eubacterium sp.]|nr:DUF3298 domain-containing protein [Eubacterium sp.]
MKPEDFMKAISYIDEEFVAEAASETNEINVDRKVNKRQKTTRKGGKIKIFTGVAAAMLAGMILLPNMSLSVARAWEKLPVLSTVAKVVVWRDYRVAEGMHEADIEVPHVNVETAEAETPAIKEEWESSQQEINLSVDELTNQIIEEFEAYLMADEEQSLVDHVQVGHEIVTDSEQYFSMKVWTLEEMASGFEQNYYYTIDRKTGKLLKLSDLFEDASYIEAISEEIKTQMATEMAEDEEVIYWLNDPDIPESNFTQIAPDQSFYITADGALMICFNEGDVAPMYMGCVCFEMPQSLWTQSETGAEKQ